MTERPLNVRVAEALGCRVGDPTGDSYWMCLCDGGQHGTPEFRDGVPNEGRWYEVLPYGENTPAGWSVTGPLMAQYCPEIIIRDWRRVSSRPDFRDGVCSKRGEFQAYPPGDPLESWGPTITEAVANLIITLAEAGRLSR